MPQLTDFLIQGGIPQDIVAWLLFTPLAITIIVIGRQVVGMRGIGIAAPLLLGFAFVNTGIHAGIIIFFLILTTGVIIRAALLRVRLLYLPKIAIIFISALLVILLILPFLPYRQNLSLPTASFALLILFLSTEQLISLLAERGLKKTLSLSLETLVMGIVVFFTASAPQVKSFTLAYPLFVIAGSIALNLLLGKWAGIRISEYLRFKNIIFKK